jgi:tetratricopeptide (TPR) repeat protein
VPPAASCHAAAAPAAEEAGEASPAVIDSMLTEGAGLLMDAHFDEAEALFQKTIDLAPDDPGGYVAIAGAYWWLVARDPTVTGYDRELLHHTEIAIDKAEEAHQRDEESARYLFFLGGAYGIRGRHAVLREKWFRAARDGKKAVNLLKDALERDPELYDAYLGLGMYDYYASVLPDVVKLVQKILFIPSGNRERGLEELQLCREKGRFARVEAQFFLVDIYLEYEKRAYDALGLLRDLERRYPDNPYFTLLEGIIYIDHMARYAEGIRTLDVLRERADAGECFFAEDIAIRTRYYLGKGHLWRREIPRALEYLGAVRESGIEDPDWLVPWATFRMGQAYDLAGDREKAIEAYRAVEKGPDVGKLREYARERLKEPFTMGGDD